VAEPSDAERIEAERRAFAIPRATGVLRGIDLSMLDPADSDERRLLIEAEHPELAEALERGDDETVVDGYEINPRLHLTIHEVITSQLWTTILRRRGRQLAGCSLRAMSGTRSSTCSAPRSRVSEPAPTLTALSSTKVPRNAPCPWTDRHARRLDILVDRVRAQLPDAAFH
jgi:hypothetical protein